MVLDGRRSKITNHATTQKPIADDPHDDCTHWIGFL